MRHTCKKCCKYNVKSYYKYILFFFEKFCSLRFRRYSISHFSLKKWGLSFDVNFLPLKIISCVSFLWFSVDPLIIFRYPSCGVNFLPATKKTNIIPFRGRKMHIAAIYVKFASFFFLGWSHGFSNALHLLEKNIFAFPTDSSDIFGSLIDFAEIRRIRNKMIGGLTSPFQKTYCLVV